MPIVNKHLVTHHKPEHLFELVSDIKRYPEFIRWIKAMRVTGHEAEGAVTQKLGEALVGFKGFSESFATRVTCHAVEYSVDVKLVRGPFRRLENKWRFPQIEGGATRIEFYIDYEFSNPILRMLARANTDSAIQGIMDSFIVEANKRYGAAPVST